MFQGFNIPKLNIHTYIHTYIQVDWYTYRYSLLWMNPKGKIMWLQRFEKTFASEKSKLGEIWDLEKIWFGVFIFTNATSCKPTKTQISNFSNKIHLPTSLFLALCHCFFLLLLLYFIDTIEYKIKILNCIISQIKTQKFRQDVITLIHLI